MNEVEIVSQSESAGRLGRPGKRAPFVLAGLLAIVLVLAGLAASGAPWVSAPNPTGTDPGHLQAAFVLLNKWVDQPGELLRLDPDDGEIGRSVESGTDPAFTVSPSGHRLYLASGQDASGRFEVVDTDTGKVVYREPLLHRWLNTLPAYFPAMRVSPDGSLVYVLGFDSVAPGRDAYFARVFETTAGRFRDEQLSLACEAPLLVPTQTILHAACPHTGQVLSVPIESDGGFGLIATAAVSESGIMGMVQVPGSSEVVALTRTGRVIRLGDTGAKDLFEVADESLKGLVYDAFSISPDGSTVYIGLDGVSRGRISRIEAYELPTGHRVAGINLPVEAWTFSMGSEGDRLYVAAHEAERLLILDPTTLEVRQELEVPGNPTLVIGP